MIYLDCLVSKDRPIMRQITEILWSINIQSNANCDFFKLHMALVRLSLCDNIIKEKKTMKV